MRRWNAYWIFLALTFLQTAICFCQSHQWLPPIEPNGSIRDTRLSTANGNNARDSIVITLNPAAVGRMIPPDFVGLSFETNSLNRGYFGPGRDTLIHLFQTLGVKSLRIGGNSVDKDTLGDTTTGTHFTRADIDSVFQFAMKARCGIILGLNFGGAFNPTAAATEASYVLQQYGPVLSGFEVGNEPDLYRYNGFRSSTYGVADYIVQYSEYYDSIRTFVSNAVFTGPASASSVSTFTLPFCRSMKGKISMLTQHYYVGAAYAAPARQQVVTLLSETKLESIVNEVVQLVGCADSSGIPFRMGECNSFYNGGQYGVSDAFASALWALDYMYALASRGCSGVNFHGGLSGAYTSIVRQNSVYRARPIYYGILAFQIGSKGRFISSTIANSHSNLNAYSVLDSLYNIYTTIVNKDTLNDAFIILDAGDARYQYGEFVTLNSPSLSDTVSVSLGGQVVNTLGTLPLLGWQALKVENHATQVGVPAGSAAVVRFTRSPLAGVDNPKNGVRQGIPEGLVLAANYPNPFNPTTTIRYGLPHRSHVTLTVFNTLGQQVETLVDKSEEAGYHEVRFDASGLASGVYFYRLHSESFVQTKRLLLLR